jgi:hypothetical protein
MLTDQQATALSQKFRATLPQPTNTGSALVSKNYATPDEFLASINSKPSPDEYQPTFAPKPTDSPMATVGKTIGNIPGSAYNFGKTVVSAVANPARTADSIGSLGAGAFQALGEKAMGRPIANKTPDEQKNEQTFNAVKDFFASRYGGIDNIANTIVSDPVGFATDLATALEGGGALLKGAGNVSKVEAISNAGKVVSKAGEAIQPIRAVVPALKVAAKASKGAAALGQKLAGYATSQATGLSPDTIKRIISNPEDFSPAAMKEFTREGVASKAFGDVEARMADLSDTGKEYQGVREAKTPVSFKPGTFEEVLAKENIGVDESGKLTFSKESTPTSKGDQSALQEWYNTYGKDQEHTSNSFLNARKALDNLAQWDSSKTDAANRIAMSLRKTLNETGRSQVEGLEALDTKFASEITDLKKVKVDYFNKDGSLKDNAIGKIANLSNKGRDVVLERLEKISPGIGEKVRTLKAVEDIHAASGQKVGAYARAIVPGAVGFAAGGAVGAIASAILSSPEIATQILRGYGKVMGLKDSAIKQVITNYEKSSPTNPPRNLPIKENPMIDKSSTIQGNASTDAVKSQGFNQAGTAKVPDLGAHYDTITPLAKETQGEINKLANSYIEKYGGELSDPGIKAKDSWLRKVAKDYEGDVTKMTDTARNSIVHDNPSQIYDAILKGERNVSEGGKVVSSKFKTHATDELGFEGGNIKLKGSNGSMAEMQTVTPDMVFAKEPTGVAKSILGEAKYQEMLSKYGNVGGEGHKFFEDWRDLDKTSQEAIDIAKQSKDYYAQFTR